MNENLKNIELAIEDFRQGKFVIVISVGFEPSKIPVDYIFCSNLRKYEKVHGCNVELLITSNVHYSDEKPKYVFNYDSYLSKHIPIVDNGGLMLIKILRACGIKEVVVAGMDGYSFSPSDNKVSDQYVSQIINNEQVNSCMSSELSELMKDMEIEFLTPSRYV